MRRVSDAVLLAGLHRGDDVRADFFCDAHCLVSVPRIVREMLCLNYCTSLRGARREAKMGPPIRG